MPSWKVTDNLLKESMMELTGRTARQIQLLSLVLLIVPMIIFPERLGTPLMRGAMIYAIYEMVYYGFVVYFFNRQASLGQVIQSAGICLMYRLAMGLLLGLLLAAMYSMGIFVSITFGLSGYMPAVLLHMLAAPFVLRPVIGKFLGSRATERNLERPSRLQSEVTAAQVRKTAIAVDTGYGTTSPRKITVEPQGYGSRPAVRTRSAGGLTDVNDFEKAVNYIGEHGSVQLAAVVDAEGLLLANFVRGATVAEDIAPLAVTLLERNAPLVGELGSGSLNRIDLHMKDTRLVVVEIEPVSLMTIAQIQTDDLLNIRINQGVEMVKKQLAERYGQTVFASAETEHVSSTQ